MVISPSTKTWWQITGEIYYVRRNAQSSLVVQLLLFISLIINPRPAGGCLNMFEHPHGVFVNNLKTAARSAAVFAHLIIHLFHTCCENFRPRPRKVRSPGHVKRPHLIKSLNVPPRYTDWTIALKPSGIATRKGIYKTYILEFLYLWLKVRSILWPLHYKSMGEKWKAPLLEGSHSKHSQTSVYR